MDKLEKLQLIMSEMSSVAVAYSGGADSAFLADVSHEVLGASRSVAVTAVSPSLAPSERTDARELALERGWSHLEIETKELDDERYRANDANRCYFCKTELFEVLEALAPSLNVSHMVLGTNLDDLDDFRPGQRAAREHDVRAPLLEAGLTKQEIRDLSKKRGLRTWNKPAAACLSSRIAYGIEVTPERLERIAKAESIVRSFGATDVRVRDHGDLARVEVNASAVATIAQSHAELSAGLKALGFNYVTLDLEGFRSGSMNGLLNIRRKGESHGLRV
ncbi:MAG: ATP-dependent sacrificial sulfur transferase LarE [Actinomycetota bacterium]